MNKVLVLGCAGSGKSTFSRKLGQITGLPVIHLDSLYWKPGWVASSNLEWDLIIEKLAAKDKYIMDGNYSRTISIRLQEADTVFYFDFPRFLCLYRILKRRIINHGMTRVDMAEGCKEKIDWEFIKWVWNFNKKNRPRILESLEVVKDHKNIVIFKNPGEVRNYLK